MNVSKTDLRDACRLFGGLALDGARVDILREIQRERLAATLAPTFGGELREALSAMQDSLDTEDPESLAVEYTRLMVANGDEGARSRIPVPPWEDCYAGGTEERKILGIRSKEALRAYAAAGLGFDGMMAQPADHIGLELCFVAALLDEEERGVRDPSARTAFVEQHLKRFSPTLGQALTTAARTGFWRETGRAMALLPTVLQ